MDIKKSEELISINPKIFGHLPFGFECGDGWFELLKELITNISKVLEDKDLDIYEHCPFTVTQVKEKYGTLRFYTTWITDEVEKLIDLAEVKSSITCEVCGKSANLFKDGYWYKVRCEQCNED
jgi:hypothetical protein